MRLASVLPYSTIGRPRGKSCQAESLANHFPFSEEPVRRFPHRFSYVVRYDPDYPEIEGLIAQASKATGCVGVRIASGPDFKILKTGGHGKVLDAALKYKMPVMVGLPRRGTSDAGRLCSKVSGDPIHHRSRRDES
jgi:hypothetical protein